MEERRGYERFIVNDDVYAYRAKRVAKIRNISMTGLLCICVHHNDCLPVDFDIFCPGSCICLGGIPYTIIEIKSIDFSQNFVRQCHVQFDPLSHKKILELERFIKKYTVTG